MIRASLLALFSTLIICGFCGKEFISLGRHTWRCKNKVEFEQTSQQNGVPNVEIRSQECLPINSYKVVKCCCGKICKGARGLKMHQRSCKVIDDMQEELKQQMTDALNDQICDDNVQSVEDTFSRLNAQETLPDLKRGIKLPKSPLQWSNANDFFHLTLSNCPVTTQEINKSINTMATVIYNYFSENYGFIDVNNNNEFESKYKSCSVKELKKALKELKCDNGDIKEIKFVARQLRYLLNKNNIDPLHTNVNASSEVDHDKLLNNNFWGYIKKFFKKKSESLPTFDLSQCTTYFTKTLSAVIPNKTFNIPSWIPKFNSPTTPFNLDPPTYNEISNVIRKMKPSGSPCPLDQISVICLKRCPYLRTYLTEIIHAAWSSGIVPSEWKKACTILIHKKHDTDNPANFRPITLESVPLKVFTSCLRNKIFTFLSENNYIEHEIQKGFTPNVAGTVEHTAHMAHIINSARIKQRSLVITLLDLKNAFGELHHNLIYEVLQYHHIPDPINELIRSLYTNFQTSIITDKFSTPFITVGRGVLQGDCLSPLLFNMSFNTFVQHIKSESFMQLGFWKFNKSGIPCNPIHWFQFADDAAVISSQEKENQILLNRFSVWCQWASMIIRVDKCSTFGIKKHLSKSVQYLPKLFINHLLVPRIEIGESFRYLGRYFNFNMSDEKHQSEICDLFNNIISNIDELPLHPRNKILLYSRYLLSKISWDFTITDITKTWVCENLDSIATKFLRKWLELPISATLSNVYLPYSKFGLNVILPSTKFTQCQTVSRAALKSSINENIRELWSITCTNRNIQYDIYSNTKDVLKAFRQKNEQRLKNDLISQGSFFSNIIENSTLAFNSLWSSVQSKLPKNVFNFSLRYINNSLPTRKNLVKWGLSSSADCSSCFCPETLLHVVSGCKTYLDEGRFTWRHNSVLNFIASSLLDVERSKLYVDLPGFISPSVVTGDQFRPDLLLSIENRILYILELTVGFETNLQINSDRKHQKYLTLIADQENVYDTVKFVNVSVSSLGVFGESTNSLFAMLHDLKFDEQRVKYVKKKIIATCIRTSYYIFCRRNKEWNNPELLKF